MKTQNPLFEFVLKEWLLLASASGVVITSVYLSRVPTLSLAELQVLFILGVLFVAVRGLERSGLVLRLSQMLEAGKFIPLRLVVATFVLSMLVTNDVALVVIVPLTLALRIGRKDILVILEALAANAGSALTPIGNPQNLYIYWFYNVRVDEFIASIAPFSLVFFAVLTLASVFMRRSTDEPLMPEPAPIRQTALAYGALLLTVVAAVLRVVPLFVGFFVLVYAVVFDRDSLRIDYPLLLTFGCFFALSENVQSMFAGTIEHAGHIFVSSALLSQIISNVPATLLFAKFTTRWQALLWGASVGGFGSLVGSLANLIAYRYYVTQDDTNDAAAFTTKFIAIGYLAFALGLALYWATGKLR